MLFNSLQFFLFFSVVFSLYHLLSSRHILQNRILLAASYIFYASWDWRFLSLIWFSTLLNFICGIKMGTSDDEKQKKLYLILSITGNLGMLGFFKYFNFFAANFHALLNIFGLDMPIHYLHIILPVGISFYTFQAMSYTIDVYTGKMEPTHRFFDFALFIAFFPQLIAGPIERARVLLPQIFQPRTVTLDKFYEGSYLIFWGLFQKVFIADNLARFVNPLFAQNGPYLGADVLIATYAFCFQIFCDFAGYSNIARGLGKMLGIELSVNFDNPYFSQNIQEFWRRWHMTLSFWLRDYLFIPLSAACRNYGKRGIVAAAMITFGLCGLWHGAGWGFILFGVIHGVYLSFSILTLKSRDNFMRKLPVHPKIVFAWRVFLTFHMVALSLLFFRAQSATQAFEMIVGLLYHWPQHSVANLTGSAAAIIPYLVILWIVQIIQYTKKDLLAVLKWPLPTRAVFYYVCFVVLIIFGVTGAKEFIYFQF